MLTWYQWCEDLDAEPILAVWSGVYLNGYDNDNPYDIPKEEIGLYVQEAMDELEFILGDVHTKFGALRASLGHPRPWKLNYVEVYLPFLVAVHFQGRRLNIMCDYRLATKITFLVL